MVIIRRQFGVFINKQILKLYHETMDFIQSVWVVLISWATLAILQTHHLSQTWNSRSATKNYILSQYIWIICGISTKLITKMLLMSFWCSLLITLDNCYSLVKFLQTMVIATFRHHCVKSVRIRSFPDPYFPAFWLNTDQKNSETNTFYAVHMSRISWFALLVRRFSYCEKKPLITVSMIFLLIWVTLGRKNDLYLDLPF